MSINRIQKLLFSEYCDFEDMVLVESPFAETTREGRGLRQVHLGLTPSKLVLATDILPIANDSSVSYAPGVDPDIETFELIAVYPIECVNLSVFHRRKRQSLKARFCNNKILYFELGGFEKRNMFWNLWCEKVKFLSPENPNSSHSETSVATSTTNSTMYLVSSKRFVNQVGNSQLWCQYAAGDFVRSGPPAKWTDKHLYLGKNLDEDPLKYTPCQNLPTVEEFVHRKHKHKEERNVRQLPVCSSNMTTNSASQVNRFSSGVKENCSSKLFLPTDIIMQRKFSNDTTTSINAFTLYKTLSGHYLDFPELAEDAVRLWEFYKVTSSTCARGKHRRRYALCPQPYFLQGLGPWSVNHGERFSLQMKRAVSVVAIKRQPVEPELRLSVSRRQLVASISCDTLHEDDKLINMVNNTIRIPAKEPLILFWTPEYWYRPRRPYDAYQELQTHLRKIRQYHQLKESFRSRIPRRRGTRHNSDSTDSEDEVMAYKRRRNKTGHVKRVKKIKNTTRKHPEIYDRGDKDRESPMQQLRRILKMEVSLTAWDFDSNTLAFQLTIIDKELFLKITPNELGVLVWQQSSKNAPNISALIAFSHRISCLVVTEILKDDSEKIRARLVARFINIAEKCNQISNFHSCRSVLCGLQSPPIFRLYATWTYLRKRHSSKYETFEKLCRLYRDPRLYAYQHAFINASRTAPYMPYIGDILGRLLDRIPDYNIDKNSNNLLGIKISVKQNDPNGEKREEIPTLLQKILSSLKVFQADHRKHEDRTAENCACKTETIIKYKGLSDYYKPYYEDNRQLRLNECVKLLKRHQKATSNFLYTKNELAREYLLKARYREDKENFIYSFSVEPSVHLDNS